MKQTPMYQLYAGIAPRPGEWARLLSKIAPGMVDDFDLSSDVARITASTMIVAGDASIVPPAHAVEVFGLLGGCKRYSGCGALRRPGPAGPRDPVGGARSRRGRERSRPRARHMGSPSRVCTGGPEMVRPTRSRWSASMATPPRARRPRAFGSVRRSPR